MNVITHSGLNVSYIAHGIVMIFGLPGPVVKMYDSEEPNALG
jgi:hypothetical protein